MTEHDTTERDTVAWKNSAALAELQKTYGLFFRPGSLKNWRPTARIAGDIPGVRDNLVCICTDGLMGYFISEWDRERPVFYGHVTSFQWHKEMVSVLPYYDKVTQRIKYFQSVRKSGVPPTLFCCERKRGSVEEDEEFEKTAKRERRVRLSPMEKAMALLRTLKEKV